VLFFFASRRRHTRSKRDWSSDVCSSDLEGGHAVEAPEPLVDLALDDLDVVLVLLEEELDRLEAQGHVPGLIRLRGEAEGHRRQRSEERRVGKEGRCDLSRHSDKKKEHVE